MMKFSALMAAGCALGAMMGIAWASDDGFDAFKQICVVTHADREKALAAADGAGWMPVPQTVLDKLPTIDFKEPQGRIRTTASVALILLVGHGSPPFAAGVDMHVCAMAVVPPDADAFAQKSADLAGVPIETVQNGNRTIYVWREENGAHVVITENAKTLKKLVDNGGVTFLVTQSDEKMSMVILEIPVVPEKTGTTSH